MKHDDISSYMECSAVAQDRHEYLYFWGRGGGPTLLMSVHPLILAKCSQNRQTKIDKNRQNLFFAL